MSCAITGCKGDLRLFFARFSPRAGLLRRRTAVMRLRKLVLRLRKCSMRRCKCSMRLRKCSVRRRRRLLRGRRRLMRWDKSLLRRRRASVRGCRSRACRRAGRRGAMPSARHSRTPAGVLGMSGDDQRLSPLTAIARGVAGGRHIRTRCPLDLAPCLSPSLARFNAHFPRPTLAVWGRSRRSRRAAGWRPGTFSRHRPTERTSRGGPCFAART